MRVVLLTNHYLESRNKAGFHWIADAFWRAGWDVLLLTESISWLSWLRGDSRFTYPIFRDAFRIRQIKERLASYIWLTPYHPIHLRSRLLNKLFAVPMRKYGSLPLGPVSKMIKNADLFVFDSDHGLFLVERIRKLNLEARLIYRVSDDLVTMGHPPVVLQQESRVLSLFDLISVPSEAIQRRLRLLPNVRLQHHGLRKDLFDASHPNPFRTKKPNVIFVGRHKLDTDFLLTASSLFPEWTFHVFGMFKNLQPRFNVMSYGERPFEELIPYLRHADVGLQTLIYTPGAECFTDSLKVQQYTYCKLPIVAPYFLRNTNHRHIFYYQPGNSASIQAALTEAIRFPRSEIDSHQVRSWDDLVREFISIPSHYSPEIRGGANKDVLAHCTSIDNAWGEKSNGLVPEPPTK